MIHVVLCDESGNSIGDGIDVEPSVFVAAVDDRFCCLRFVDPYGDAVFNRLQLPLLSDELRLLKTLCQDEKSRIQIEQIERLVHRCRQEIHTYLKFIGD